MAYLPLKSEMYVRNVRSDDKTCLYVSVEDLEIELSWFEIKQTRVLTESKYYLWVYWGYTRFRFVLDWRINLTYSVELLFS